MSGNELWGEIKDPREKYVPDVSADIERSMNNFCLSEFDSDTEDNDNQVEHLTINSMDPIMLYGISLHKFTAELTDQMNFMAEISDSNLTILQSEEDTPKIPEPPKIYYKHVPNNLNYIPKVKTDFSEGKPVIQPELSHAVAKKILMQSVATMFAHIGYEKTHSDVLLLMTEVLEDYLKKISMKMKSSWELKPYQGKTIFPHYAERVLNEIGIGHEGIHDYYQNRVLKYTTVLYIRCQKLVERYQNSLQPQNEDNKEDGNKFGSQLDEEEEDVVEVQMHPTLEGQAEYASLATGFQLLHTLETDDFGDLTEDGSSTLPNIASASSDSLGIIGSQASKKKRTKYTTMQR